MIYLKKRNKQQAENFSFKSRISDLIDKVKDVKEKVVGRSFTPEEIKNGEVFKHYGEDLFTSPFVAHKAAKAYSGVADKFRKHAKSAKGKSKTKQENLAEQWDNMAEKIRSGQIAAPTSTKALSPINYKNLAKYAKDFGIKLPSQDFPMPTFYTYGSRRPLKIKAEDFVFNNKGKLGVGATVAAAAGTGHLASGDPDYPNHQTKSNNQLDLNGVEDIDYTNPNWETELKARASKSEMTDE